MKFDPFQFPLFPSLASVLSLQQESGMNFPRQRLPSSLLPQTFRHSTNEELMGGGLFLNDGLSVRRSLSFLEALLLLGSLLLSGAISRKQRTFWQALLSWVEAFPHGVIAVDLVCQVQLGTFKSKDLIIPTLQASLSTLLGAVITWRQNYLQELLVA